MSSTSENAPLPTWEDGRWVIVRSQAAGVQYGRLDHMDGDTAYLTEARQMWEWMAARGGTLLDCATFGVDPKKCKFSQGPATVIIFGVCAVIDITPKALATFRRVKW
jgi:hypothetical protein